MIPHRLERLHAATVLVGRRYLSLDSLAPLLEERGEREQEEAPALTAA